MMIDSVINDIEVCNTIHEEKIERRRKDKNVYFYFNVCFFIVKSAHLITSFWLFIHIIPTYQEAKLYLL